MAPFATYRSKKASSAKEGFLFMGASLSKTSIVSVLRSDCAVIRHSHVLVLILLYIGSAADIVVCAA